MSWFLMAFSSHESANRNWDHNRLLIIVSFTLKITTTVVRAKRLSMQQTRAMSSWRDITSNKMKAEQKIMLYFFLLQLFFFSLLLLLFFHGHSLTLPSLILLIIEMGLNVKIAKFLHLIYYNFMSMSVHIWHCKSHFRALLFYHLKKFLQLKNVDIIGQHWYI